MLAAYNDNTMRFGASSGIPAAGRSKMFLPHKNICFERSACETWTNECIFWLNICHSIRHGTACLPSFSPCRRLRRCLSSADKHEKRANFSDSTIAHIYIYIYFFSPWTNRWEQQLLKRTQVWDITSASVCLDVLMVNGRFVWHQRESTAFLACQF